MSFQAWVFSRGSCLGCDIGGAKELGVIYFPTNWGAKEPQNLPNHRVVVDAVFFWFGNWFFVLVQHLYPIGSVGLA